METFRSGNGAAWLDFMVTLSGRYRARPVDALADPPALRAWLRANDLEPTAAVTADDLAGALATREALHRLTVATLRGTAPAAGDVRTVAAALAEDRPLHLAPGGRLALRRPASVAEAVGRLVRDAVQDLAGPRRDELHACGDDTCSGIFLDGTGRRRWCSDQTCGNRMRVRAHRAHRAGRDGAAASG